MHHLIEQELKEMVTNLETMRNRILEIIDKNDDLTEDCEGCLEDAESELFEAAESITNAIKADSDG